ncbi:unnamed protein product [Caenorhabditis nigoni]
MSTSSNQKKFCLEHVPRTSEKITPDAKNMKLCFKNVKDESVMVLVDCESFMFKIKNPKSQKCLVTQQLQELKKGEVIEVGLEFRNPDEDKKHLKSCYRFKNAGGRIIVSHADIDSFTLVRRYCDGVLYDPEKAPPHHLMRFYGDEHASNLILLAVNAENDTEESKKIKDVFGTIMLDKARKAADRKALEKKEKKCCTIL